MNKKVFEKNILEVAYQQLAEQYPKFLPLLIRYAITEVNEEEGTALGNFTLLINDSIVHIPIIYRDGNVDATSYIGNDDEGIYYALTKSIYNKICSSVVNDLGMVIDKNKAEQNSETIDRGVIGQLFATPSTFSPKVASVNKFSLKKIAEELGEPPAKVLPSNMLTELAQKSDQVYQGLKKLASQNPYFKNLINDLVNWRAVETNRKMTKLASMEDEAPTVYFTVDETKGLPKHKRQEALQKIAMQGFYVDRKEITKTAMPIEKIAQTFAQTISKSMETVSMPGIWTVMTKDHKLKTIIVGNSDITTSDDTGTPVKELKAMDNKGTEYRKVEEVVGVPFTDFDVAKAKIVLENTMSINTIIREGRSDFTLIAIEPNKDVFIKSLYTTPIKTPNGYLIREAGKFGSFIYKNILITPQVNNIMLYGDTILIPDSKVLFKERKEIIYSASREFATLSDLTIQNILPGIIKVASNNGALKINNGWYSARGAVIKLAREGFDDESINTIIKTAAQSNTTEQLLAALNTQMANLQQIAQQQTMTLQQLTQLIAEMKQSIDTQTAIQTQAVQQTQSAAQPDMSQADDASAQKQDTNTQAQAQTQQLQGQDNGQDEQQLVEAITQLAQTIGQDPNQLIQQAQAQGMSLEDLYVQLANYIQQAQSQGGQAQAQTQQQDPNAQAQAQTQQQDPNAQAAMAQDPNAQAAMGGQGMQGQPPAGDNQGLPPTDPNGFVVSNIDPATLAKLEEIANKQALDGAILTYLVNLDNPDTAIKQYVDEIKTGINGLVRVLLIIDTNYKDLLKNISETTLSSFLNRGKSLAKRLTDFYVKLITL